MDNSYEKYIALCPECDESVKPGDPICVLYEGKLYHDFCLENADEKE